jgi:hypothetical protein
MVLILKAHEVSRGAVHLKGILGFHLSRLADFSGDIVYFDLVLRAYKYFARIKRLI